MKNDKVIVFGSGGHSGVLIETLENLNYYIVGLIDSYEQKGVRKFNYDILGDEEELKDALMKFQTNQVVIAVGENYDRSEIYKRLIRINKDLEFPVIISPNTIVSKTARFGQGTVVLDGSIVHGNTDIGIFNILNTASIVEHDVKLGNFVSLAPRVAIGGRVNIGDFTYVGVATTIIQNISIGKENVIGAGSVVLNNFSNKCLIVGAPAFVKKKNYLNKKVLK
jgi:sugar O-acyltransferase (sialic acid O-acetyltransferase NeuD family)